MFSDNTVVITPAGKALIEGTTKKFAITGVVLGKKATASSPNWVCNVESIITTPFDAEHALVRVTIKPELIPRDVRSLWLKVGNTLISSFDFNSGSLVLNAGNTYTIEMFLEYQNINSKLVFTPDAQLTALYSAKDLPTAAGYINSPSVYIIRPNTSSVIPETELTYFIVRNGTWGMGSTILVNPPRDVDYSKTLSNMFADSSNPARDGGKQYLTDYRSKYGKEIYATMGFPPDKVGALFNDGYGKRYWDTPMASDVSWGFMSKDDKILMDQLRVFWQAWPYTYKAGEGLLGGGLSNQNLEFRVDPDYLATADHSGLLSTKDKKLLNYLWKVDYKLEYTAGTYIVVNKSRDMSQSIVTPAAMVVMSELISIGMFDNVYPSMTPPPFTDVFWFDVSSYPYTLRVYLEGTWEKATYSRIWGDQFKRIEPTEVFEMGPQNGPIILDASKFRNFTMDLLADCQINILPNKSLPDNEKVTLTISVKQDATANRKLLWSANIKWQGGVAPEPSFTPLATDLYQLMSFDAGHTWFGGKLGESLL